VEILGQLAVPHGSLGLVRGARARSHGMVRSAIPAAMALAMGGCAAPDSHAGIDLRPGAAAADLQQLARRAQAGDKQAQLELGIRYEEGLGVAIDVARAARLYRAAAADSSGTTQVYSPPVGRGRGQVISVRTGPRVAGLAEARARLARIRARRRGPRA
jgi:hypothetical protein